MLPRGAAGPVAGSVDGPRADDHASDRRDTTQNSAKTQAGRRGLPRHRDGNAEARIQAAVVKFIRTVAPDILVFHIPNGGLRGKAEAARLKWVGTLAGLPDLCLIVPVGRVFFMEIKTANGRLSEDQKQIHGWLTSIGVGSAVIRSIDDARIALKAWNIPTREHGPLAGLDPKTREAWRQSAIEWRSERDAAEQRGGDDE